MFGISGGEFIVILVIAAFVLANIVTTLAKQAFGG